MHVFFSRSAPLFFFQKIIIELYLRGSVYIYCRQACIYYEQVIVIIQTCMCVRWVRLHTLHALHACFFIYTPASSCTRFFFVGPYICIYIRERERERERSTYMHAFTHTSTSVHPFDACTYALTNTNACVHAYKYALTHMWTRVYESLSY